MHSFVGLAARQVIVTSNCYSDIYKLSPPSSASHLSTNMDLLVLLSRSMTNIYIQMFFVQKVICEALLAHDIAT